MKKSLLDVAYEIISQSDTEILFKDLWVKVNQVEGESPENMQGKIGKFYTALLTDGRFSGASKGPAIGHISPEAAVGGPIALIEEGDM